MNPGYDNVLLSVTGGSGMARCDHGTSRKRNGDRDKHPSTGAVRRAARRMHPGVTVVILVMMKRVVVLGRGGAGKSTAAVHLGKITGLPVIELDKHFWRLGPAPMPPDAWTQLQHELAAGGRRIMDGDFGPYDALAARLGKADTVLILDFSLARCAWRAARRSRERADFWWWLLTWRHQSRAAALHSAATFAAAADVHIVRTPAELPEPVKPDETVSSRN